MGHPVETTLRSIRLATGPWLMNGGAFTDNNTNLNGTPSDNASGSISVPMKGSRALATIEADDTAAVYFVAPLLDCYGRQCTGDKVWSVVLEVDFPDGAPVVGDNVLFSMGIYNENGPTGTAVDAVVNYIEFTAAVGANARTRYNVLVNGVLGTAVNGTATTAGVVGVSMSVRRTRTGGGVTGLLQASSGVAALNSSGVLITGSGVVPNTAVSSIGVGAIYIIGHIARTLVGDTDNITVMPRFRYTCSPQCD